MGLQVPPFVLINVTRLIYRLRISMKIHVCIKQGLFQSGCNLTLELIFKSENQRNWPNQCNFLIVTLSSRLLFVIFSLLQRKFLGGNKWVSTELCVTLCEFHFSNCPKYLDAFIPYFADVYMQMWLLLVGAALWGIADRLMNAHWLPSRQ